MPSGGRKSNEAELLGDRHPGASVPGPITETGNEMPVRGSGDTEKLCKEASTAMTLSFFWLLQGAVFAEKTGGIT